MESDIFYNLPKKQVIEERVSGYNEDLNGIISFPRPKKHWFKPSAGFLLAAAVIGRSGEGNGDDTQSTQTLIDSDGIDDGEEGIQGTDPNNVDNDGNENAKQCEQKKIEMDFNPIYSDAYFNVEKSASPRGKELLKSKGFWSDTLADKMVEGFQKTVGEAEDEYNRVLSEIQKNNKG